ncbi:MAG TPA: UDP-N-acetylmuramoyl-L-alanine--D-glutamate ligase [Stellaceae bacterium]|nr:UDP-N-acetylmuramoyl-L-alanine--D-glutamate ligase [Stellaceae bacterium]
MIQVSRYKDRTVAVLGLAKSGRVAAQALAAAGARVLAWDDSAKTRDNFSIPGVQLADLMRADAGQWAALVMSPGIPLTHPVPHPVALRAQAAGVPVIGDIELLWQANTGARFVGITGTNGKSTTTALIGHILSIAKQPVAVGGNLGTPVLELPRLASGGTYVIEMSSFQLDLIDETRFAVALLLNVTPDHLDRHGDMAGYVKAKLRIFARQAQGDTAIVGVDDDYCHEVADGLAERPATLVRVSVGGGTAQIRVEDGRLFDGEKLVLDLTDIPTLPGRHNWQNAAMACAAAKAMGLDAQTIAQGIATYPGLPHRQELVGQSGAVRFINDSKATNADATAKALDCYDNIHWILGGKAKAGGIEALAPWFGRIRRAYLIGEAALDFARTLKGKVEVAMSGDLATALTQAADAASHDTTCHGGGKGAVVLLSPACASYDQFPNFEVRGDTFRHLVGEMLTKGDLDMGAA